MHLAASLEFIDPLPLEPLRDDLPDDFPDEDFNPDRLTGCAYWRCEEIFEARSANHQFCRKACRSRQRKWERSQERKARKSRKTQKGV